MALELFRSNTQRNRQLAELEQRTVTRVAQASAEAWVADRVLDETTQVGMQAVRSATMLALEAERLASTSPVAQAAVAEILDESLAQMRIVVHRSAESIRAAGLG
jgi:hypothetical protein